MDHRMRLGLGLLQPLRNLYLWHCHGLRIGRRCCLRQPPSQCRTRPMTSSRCRWLATFSPCRFVVAGFVVAARAVSANSGGRPELSGQTRSRHCHRGGGHGHRNHHQHNGHGDHELHDGEAPPTTPNTAFHPRLSPSFLNRQKTRSARPTRSTSGRPACFVFPNRSCA